jgi:hypothetical protein
MLRHYLKWLPIVISAAAFVVAVGSAVISYWSYSSNLTYSEINIEPLLETTGRIFEPPKSESYVVNKGRGQARLTKVEFQYDGKPHSGLAIAGIFLESQRQYNASKGTDHRCRFTMSDRLYPSLMIQAGERAVLFTTEGDCPQQANEYQWAFLQRLGLTIEYESRTGQTRALSAGGDPKFDPRIRIQK